MYCEHCMYPYVASSFREHSKSGQSNIFTECKFSQRDPFANCHKEADSKTY